MRRSPPKNSPSLRARGMQQQLQLGPLAKALNTDAVDLPEVQAPNLSSLRVTVFEDEGVTETALLERLHQLRFERGERRERSADEKVCLGDEVSIDVMGYAAGRLIPFSSRQMTTELQPMSALPGLSEGITHMQPRRGGTIQVELPADYPVPTLAGMPARFLVEIHWAKEVTLAALSSPEDFATLGRGDTIDEVMDALAAELHQEHEQQLLTDAAEQTLSALAEAIDLDLEPALIDEEILRRWGASEGRLLATKTFSDQELADALLGWQQDLLTRQETTRQVKANLALNAIMKRDEIELEDGDAQEWVADSFIGSGFSRQQIGKVLNDNRVAAKAAMVSALQLKVLRHVMARVSFDVLPPPVDVME